MKKFYIMLVCVFAFTHTISQAQVTDPLTLLRNPDAAQKQKALTFNGTHDFSLKSDSPTLPKVAAIYFNHVWTRDNIGCLPSSVCKKAFVTPDQEPGNSFDIFGFDSIKNDLIYNSRQGISPVITRSDTIVPTMVNNYLDSAIADSCYSKSATQTYINVKSFTATDSIKGLINTLGVSQGILAPARNAEAYSFCLGGVSLYEGKSMMKGQILWDPKIINHSIGKVAGIRQKGGTNDPIVFSVRDSVDSLLDSGTLLSIKLTYDSGTDTVDLINYWDNDTVHIESPNAEFDIDFPSPYTSLQGHAHLKIVNDTIILSDDSGFFDTKLPISGTVPIIFHLDDSLYFHYNLDTLSNYTNDSLRVKFLMYGNCINNYVSVFDTVILAPVIIQPSCFACTDGSICVSAISGIPSVYGFNYMWSNGATGQCITGLGAGVYTVTVTDSLCAETSVSYTLTPPPLLALTVNSKTNPTSAALSSGAINITASGGITPYIYIWSNASTNQNLTGLTAGTYTVTVTDANGATTTKSVTLTINCTLSYTTQVVQNASCYFNNGIVTVIPTGGSSYSYSWQTTPVQTTATATGLAYGVNSYVTITDASGCAITATVLVPTSLGLSLNLTSPVFAGGKNISCNGGSNGSINLTVSGSTGPYSYLWNNGTTTQNRFGLSAGTYTVTVTNGGCTATGFITLTQSTAMQLTATKINPSCFGGSNGTATAIASGGISPYSYSWNTIPVKTGATATGLAAGAYTVTVTDANGCTKTVSIALSSPADVVVTGIVTNANCFGGSTGSIDITPSGGTPPYTYLWNTGATTQDRINVLAAGTYTVTVTDSKGCTKQYSNSVGQPTAIAATSATTNVSCYGASTGSATVTASGGTPPYTYSWNTTPAKTTATVTGLKKGTYTALITDSKGCVKAVTVNITEPVSISISISKTNVTVHGGSNGTATANVSGGIAPYSYSWNTIPVKTTQTATGLIAGTYTVTVTDANGCTRTGSITVTQPARFAVNNAPDGTPYSFLYPNPATGLTTVTFNELITTSVTVTIFNMNGQRVYEEMLKPIQNNNSFELDLSHFTKGIYTMKYRTNDKEWIDKLVIQ
ncbi:MAG: T9SS type A sorting domain-containing protein [Bacteroidia bacterium]